MPSRSPLARPAGPLPARVYWFRRAVVLVVPLVLVLLLGSFLTRSSDGSDGAADASAVRAGFDDASDEATASTSATASAPARDRTGTATTSPTKRAEKKQKEVLAAPDGPCAASDVVVDPSVTDAVAGRDVRIRLFLRTTGREACTWQVSPETLTVKITSGADDIWFSRECPAALPEKDVVVRRAKDTRLGFDWNAKRSDQECSNQVEWALPGWYHAEAAALAGEPREVQFQLEKPVPETETASPKPDKKKDRSGTDSRPRPGESAPTDEPAGADSGGATEPTG